MDLGIISLILLEPFNRDVVAYSIGLLFAALMMAFARTVLLPLMVLALLSLSTAHFVAMSPQGYDIETFAIYAGVVFVYCVCVLFLTRGMRHLVE